jgi:hypothetical protein
MNFVKLAKKTCYALQSEKPSSHQKPRTISLLKTSLAIILLNCSSSDEIFVDIYFKLSMYFSASRAAIHPEPADVTACL